MNDIIKLKEAKSRGLIRYFTGKPCHRGHISERHVSSRACCECANQKNQTRLQENPDYHSDYRKKHPHRQSWNYYKRKEKNPARHAAQLGLAFALKRSSNCTPADFDFEATVSFYSERIQLTLETGIEHHVDHIVALSNGGKHVASNLQVLSAKANAEKAISECPARLRDGSTGRFIND